MKEKKEQKQKEYGRPLNIKSINKMVRVNRNISVIRRIEIYSIYSK